MSADPVSISDLKAPQVPRELRVANVTPGFGNLQSFELMQRGAKVIAASTLVPEQYRGPDGVPNAIIALNMALRMQADPLMVMQNLYVVHGRPSWSAQFLIACFNQCGRFSSIRYEWQGKRGADDWGCRAWATEKETGEKVIGPLVTMQTAKDEGWYGKSGSKWKTIPELMLTYRAASWMVRTCAPELAMGLPTVEESQDIIDVPREQYTVDSIKAGQHAAPVAVPANEPEPEAKPDAEDAAAPTYTFEQVSGAISFAQKIDELDAIADVQIRTLKDPAHREVATAAYKKKRKEIEG